MQATTKEITRDEFFAAIQVAGFRKIKGFASYKTANLQINAHDCTLIEVVFLITSHQYRILYSTASPAEALDYALKLNALMPEE